MKLIPNYSRICQTKTEETVGDSAKLRRVSRCALGIPFMIVNGHQPGILRSILEGKDVGTFFAPSREKKTNGTSGLRFRPGGRAK